MSTLNASLPVVAGGLGASISTAHLAAKKKISISAVAGSVVIEIDVDGSGNFCGVTSVAPGETQATIEQACAAMRVNATNGDAASVLVAAEGSQIRSGAIPLPPADGEGASLDVSSFGPKMTVSVAGLTPGGSILFQASPDDVTWGSDFKTFTVDGCDFSVCENVRFIRAVGQGTSAAAIGVAAQEDAGGAALTEPRASFVYAPFKSESSGNVYGGGVSALRDVEQAMLAVAGLKTLIIDPTDDDGVFVGNPTTPTNETFDLPNVSVQSTSAAGAGFYSWEIADGCKFTRWREARGNQPWGIVTLSSQHVVEDFTPFRPDNFRLKGVVQINSREPEATAEFYHSGPGTIPIFEFEDFSGWRMFDAGGVTLAGQSIWKHEGINSALFLNGTNIFGPGLVNSTSPYTLNLGNSPQGPDSAAGTPFDPNQLGSSPLPSIRIPETTRIDFQVTATPLYNQIGEDPAGSTLPSAFLRRGEIVGVRNSGGVTYTPATTGGDTIADKASAGTPGEVLPGETRLYVSDGGTRWIAIG